MAVQNRSAADGLKTLALPLVAVAGLPLVPFALGALPLSRYLQFPPPSTLYVIQKPFSAVVFAAGVVFSILSGLFFCRKLAPAIVRVVSRRGRFPVWGRAAFVSLCAFWFLAWNRYSWFAPFQAHTYFPIWLSHIVLLNAVLYRATDGFSLLTGFRGKFLSLFPLSALFWWMFEWLNRFPQNWLYHGVEHFRPVEYFLFASISFSTVLPAIAVTKELCAAYIETRMLPAVHLSSRWVLLLRGSAALTLALLPLLPSELYPLLWISPLFLFLPRRGVLLNPVAAAFWAAAGLICGGFWELWNYYSYAKWTYHIAYVDLLQVFEMPVLGYLGYLPFGILCGVVIERSVGAFGRPGAAQRLFLSEDNEKGTYGE